MICWACQMGQLTQKYPNCIECEKCHSKWYNNNLTKKYYAKSYSRGREDWEKK